MNNYPFASMRDCFDMSAYFVVGPQDCKGPAVTDVVDDALRGGATFIQLRAKNADAKDITEMARDIAQVIKNSGKSDSVAFVIDDRVDVVWQARDKGIKVDGVAYRARPIWNRRRLARCSARMPSWACPPRPKVW